MSLPRTEQVLAAVRQAGILRPRDLDALGLPKVYLTRLCQNGLLQRMGRGLYRLPSTSPSENHSLAEASKRIPRGIVSLLSALRFHGLTTQSPFEVWLAIDFKARLPRRGNLKVRIVRFSGKALNSGVQEHQIEGVLVRVYNPAKTVVDCFKYRNKIGSDVAVEALRDCRRQRKCTNDDLWRYAKICRVANVMRPYLEATQ